MTTVFGCRQGKLRGACNLVAGVGEGAVQRAGPKNDRILRRKRIGSRPKQTPGEPVVDPPASDELLDNGRIEGLSSCLSPAVRITILAFNGLNAPA